MTLLTYTDVLLMALVFSGAALQVAGGMGFGLVAGPILIASLGPIPGIQASILLNIAVSTFGWIANRRDIKYAAIFPMLPGIMTGVLVGVTAAMLTPDLLIKIALCISLGWICLLSNTTHAQSRNMAFAFSMISGIMGGALAIPGPAAAVSLRRVMASTHAIRSSMMPLLTFTYLLTGAILFATQGITQTALSVLTLAGPSAAGGLLTGILLTNKLSESTLKLLTQLIMLGTFTSLLIITTKDLALLL